MNPDTQNGTDTNTGQSRVRLPLLGLLAVAGISVALVSFVEQRTRAQILINEAEQSRKSIAATLPAAGYDNQPYKDRQLLAAPEYLGTKKPLPVYRARNGERVVAVVLTTEAPDGYVAPIRLLVGIDSDGRIIAVRTIAHRETPGLGDAIDVTRSAWIESFKGRTLDDAPAGLALKKDGGEIDHITGATITSRAVTKAVRKALQYYELERSAIVNSQPAD